MHCSRCGCAPSFPSVKLLAGKGDSVYREFIQASYLILSYLILEREGKRRVPTLPHGSFPIMQQHISCVERSRWAFTLPRLVRDLVRAFLVVHFFGGGEGLSSGFLCSSINSSCKSAPTRVPFFFLTCGSENYGLSP